MGRESSFGTKEPINLSTLALEARHLGGSAVCWIDTSSPAQAVGGFPPHQVATELSCHSLSGSSRGQLSLKYNVHVIWDMLEEYRTVYVFS